VSAVAAATVPHLVALQPAVSPANALISEDGCTLGRGVSCQVVVPRPVVSRRHAQIERTGARFQLRDLGSVNGTYVNGLRLHNPHLLSNYDLIGLGDPAAQLTFIDPDSTCTSGARLTYDERSMRFGLGGRALELTPNQFRLLRFLHRQLGQVCSREACAAAVWGQSYAPGMDATTLDRLVSTMRATLRRADDTASLIVTRPGLGYQLCDSA
jgi:DNA-binding response OmpR family regulator